MRSKIRFSPYKCYNLPVCRVLISWVACCLLDGLTRYIITEGTVRIERQIRSQASEKEENEAENLGKLKEYDFFGEMAVLSKQDDGQAFPRFRSAICSSSVCMLNTLSYDDLAELRAQRPGIDQAVRVAVAQLRKARPSLFGAEQSNEAEGSGNGGVEERFQSLAQLNAQMMELQGQMQKQMAELQLDIRSMITSGRKADTE